MRPLVAIACAVAVAIGAGAATAAGTPRCTTAGLVVWLDTTDNHAAGSSYFKLELTNLSGHRCTLFGYPGVSAVGLTRHALGSAAGRNPHVSPHLVDLANGATATAVLQITGTGVFPRAVCRPQPAAGLRVYPPGQTTSEIVPFPFSACSRSGPAYLHVEATTR